MMLDSQRHDRHRTEVRADWPVMCAAAGMSADPSIAQGSSAATPRHHMVVMIGEAGSACCYGWHKARVRMCKPFSCLVSRRSGMVGTFGRNPGDGWRRQSRCGMCGARDERLRADGAAARNRRGSRCFHWCGRAFPIKPVSSACVGSNPTPAITRENGPRAALVRPGGPFSFGSPCAEPPWDRQVVVVTDIRMAGPGWVSGARAVALRALQDARARSAGSDLWRRGWSVATRGIGAIRNCGPAHRRNTGQERSRRRVGRRRIVAGRSCPWIYSRCITRRIFASKTCNGAKGRGGYREA